jgi:hypothetical protein
MTWLAREKEEKKKTVLKETNPTKATRPLELKHTAEEQQSRRGGV